MGLGVRDSFGLTFDLFGLIFGLALGFFTLVAFPFGLYPS